MCGKTRKSGRFKLRRITDSKRVRAKLHVLKGEMRRRMHLPIPEQGRWLASVLRGHYNYYAVPDNIEALSAFRKRDHPALAQIASASQSAQQADLEADRAPR